jgi:hypothetical protein
MTNFTPRLKLPYINEANAKINEILNTIDILLQPIVEGITDIPPAKALEGQCWIVGESPTEAWDGKANHIAQWSKGEWFFVAPYKMLQIWVESLEDYYIFNGEAWVLKGLIQKRTGESLKVEHKSEIINILGESVAPSILIPARSLIIAVNVRVLQAIKGATSFNVGVAEDQGRYGTKIGCMIDSSNIGISYHPVAYYSDTPITITPNDKEFEEGKLHVTIQYLQPKGPWDW